MSRSHVGSKNRPLPTFMWVNEVTAQVTYPTWKTDPPALSPACLLNLTCEPSSGCGAGDVVAPHPRGPPIVPTQTWGPASPPAAASPRKSGPKSPGYSPGADQGPVTLNRPPSLPDTGPPPLCKPSTPPPQPRPTTFPSPQGTLPAQGLSCFHDLSLKLTSFSPEKVIFQVVSLTHGMLHRILRGLQPDTNHDLV